MSSILPSWRNTTAREAIVGFVATVSDPSSEGFVPPAARVAVFDNDGTLWCEKPMYIQLDYLLRGLKRMAEADPALRTQQPWKAVWDNDLAWLDAAVTHHYQGDDTELHQLLKGLLALSEDQPAARVEVEAAQFVAEVAHPKFGHTYRTCIYQPMVELLEYLAAHEFTTYIVSGGGRDFLRGVAEDLYGIPRERVIGSTVAYRYDANSRTVLQTPAMDVIDDGPGKPVQIWNIIGRRPILAAGNSNGDTDMLHFTTGGDGPALGLLVQHDDMQREYAYEAGAEKALQQATANGWTVISMQNDWLEVFPPA